MSLLGLASYRWEKLDAESGRWGNPESQGVRGSNDGRRLRFRGPTRDAQVSRSNATPSLGLRERRRQGSYRCVAENEDGASVGQEHSVRWGGLTGDAERLRQADQREEAVEAGVGAVALPCRPFAELTSAPPPSIAWFRRRLGEEESQRIREGDEERISISAKVSVEGVGEERDDVVALFLARARDALGGGGGQGVPLLLRPHQRRHAGGRPGARHVPG